MELQELNGYQQADNGAERGGILAACEMLHMLSTGAASQMSVQGDEAYWDTLQDYLRRRLDNWQDSSSEYDLAVKHLVTSALRLTPVWAR
jgi:hypothetical protein